MGICIHSSSQSGVGFRRILHGVGWGDAPDSVSDKMNVLAGTGKLLLFSYTAIL